MYLGLNRRKEHNLLLGKLLFLFTKMHNPKGMVVNFFFKIDKAFECTAFFEVCMIIGTKLWACELQFHLKAAAHPERLRLVDFKRKKKFKIGIFHTFGSKTIY
jgi:hypothetical protein